MLVIKEEPFFNQSNTPLVLIFIKGSNQYLERLKEEYPFWYKSITEWINAGSISYHYLDTQMYSRGIISIETKGNLDNLIKSLKEIDKTYLAANPASTDSNWIGADTIRLQGLGGDWLAIEKYLTAKLKDTAITIEMVAKSYKRPYLFYEEVDIRNNIYYFKNGILDIPEIEYYKHFSNLLKKTVSKEWLKEYIKLNGFTLPNGLTLRQVLVDFIRNEYDRRFNEDTAFREELQRVINLFPNQYFSIAYCGYLFPKLTGIHLDLSNPNKTERVNWKGSNVIGETLEDLVYRLIRH
uniref:Uncharacterized protein n=1 Tax=Myoviridae sp. ctLnO19 TaxID=2825085 RepID=A0A8S5P0P1_9CAUD|nr:MAG TPA: hypothetical protein [Myoviridae sp. ctLnO19]